MIFLIKKFKGYLKFSAKGKNLYKFINSLHKSRIYCFNQYCKDDVFYGEIYKKNKALIELIAKRYDITLDFYEYPTLSSYAFRYKLRYGIAAGILISVITCFYFSNTVMTIEINGNKKVDDKVILSVLKECGLEKGTFLSNIDYGKCERQLRICNDDISWSAIRHTGNRIVVDINERVESPDMSRTRVPCNIIAYKSAQITSTSVFCGQLMRIVGDYVRKGDLIVSGVYCDAHGHTIKAHSMGNITGIYEEEISFIQPLTDTTASIGRIKKRNYLNLFSLKIPLFIGKNKFENYSVETNTHYFSFLNKTLPIGITDNKICETVYSDTQYTKEEAEKIIMEKIFMYEKNFLSDKKILERKISQSIQNNELHFDVTYSLEGEIGVKRDIFVK